MCIKTDVQRSCLPVVLKFQVRLMNVTGTTVLKEIDNDLEHKLDCHGDKRV